MPHADGRYPDVAVNFYGDVELVWQHPCRYSTQMNGGETGTTPADLAAKFRSVTEYPTTEPVDVTLAGFHGKRLTLQIPDGWPTATTCLRS